LAQWLVLGVLAVGIGCGSPETELICGVECDEQDAVVADASPEPGSADAAEPPVDAGAPDADAARVSPDPADVPARADVPDVVEYAVGTFREGTKELGLPIIYGMTASLVDVDMDGRVDLFVGGHTRDPRSMTEVFLNKEEGFVAIGLVDRLVGDVPLAKDLVSTSSVDLNGDGLPELIIGGYFDGLLQVLWNRGDLQFEPETLFESPLMVGSKVSGFDFFDLDQDGDLDLYVTLKYPDMMILPNSYTHPNIILMNDGEEGFDNVSQEIVPIYDCGSKQSFAALTVPRAVFGRPDLLYIANDFTFDCAFEADASQFPSYVEPHGWHMVLDQFLFSMAADYTYIS